MMEKPFVGQEVRLNVYGLRQMYGNTRGLLKLCEKTMRITYVSEESYTSGVDTWPVDVDDAEVNSFLVDNHCFDAVDTNLDGEAIII